MSRNAADTENDLFRWKSTTWTHKVQKTFKFGLEIALLSHTMRMLEQLHKAAVHVQCTLGGSPLCFRSLSLSARRNRSLSMRSNLVAISFCLDMRSLALERGSSIVSFAESSANFFSRASCLLRPGLTKPSNMSRSSTTSSSVLHLFAPSRVVFKKCSLSLIQTDACRRKEDSNTFSYMIKTGWLPEIKSHRD